MTKNIKSFNTNSTVYSDVTPLGLSFIFIKIQLNYPLFREDILSSSQSNQKQTQYCASPDFPNLKCQFYSRSQDEALVPKCSPPQIIEKSNNGQLGLTQRGFSDGSGGVMWSY